MLHTRAIRSGCSAAAVWCEGEINYSSVSESVICPFWAFMVARSTHGGYQHLNGNAASLVLSAAS